MNSSRILVGIIVLAVLGFAICLPGCSNCGHDEGSAKRFDRITLYNISNVPVDEASFQIVTAGGTPWWEPNAQPSCPFGMGPGGEPAMTPIQPGAVVGRSFCHDGEEDHEGANKVICTVIVGGLTYTCTVAADAGCFLNEASFWFCVNNDGSGKILSGSGVMSESKVKLSLREPGQFGVGP